MKRDTKGSIHVLYVEPRDEKQTVLDALSLPLGHKVGIVIVLPELACRAFQSPKDFHDIKLRKRQEDLPIVFVIPNDSLAQWARMNGFSVYSSLEALIKSNRVKPSSQLIADPSSFDNSLYERGDYPASFIPTMNSLHIQERFHPRVPDPVTPLPLHADIFPMNAQAAHPVVKKPPITTQPPPSPPPPQHILRSKQSRLFLVLTLVLIGAVLSATLLYTYRANISHGTPAKTSNIAAAGAILGQVSFSSSSQGDTRGSTGTNDIINLSLTHVTPPAQGNSYYVWLRTDSNQSDGQPIILGSLDVSSQGTAHLTYSDPQHTDLLADKSQVLITEEDATIPPIVPSPDRSTWRYEGSIFQQPDPLDHLSVLDHVRHLLAAEPSLDKQGLHGGLLLWLYRNTEKLLEWTGSARDDQGSQSAITQMRQQIIRTLDYLDGTKYVGEDVPPRTPIMVDPVLGSVGLLQLHADQTPAAYMQQVGNHLFSLTTTLGASLNQRQLAKQLDIALNDVHQWLNNARMDAKQLIVMSDNQLRQPAAQQLLDDMFNQVNNAYVGTTDPLTNAVQHGVSWIFTNAHALATIDIHADV